MVKPPRGMQPENVDLAKAGRAAGKSFADDSFRNYMARKIDLQRKQFGLVLPPPPPAADTVFDSLPASTKLEKEQPKKHGVRFANDVEDKQASTKKRKKRSGLQVVLKRLKRRHGRLKRRRGESSRELRQSHDEINDGSKTVVSEAKSLPGTSIANPSCQNDSLVENEIPVEHAAAGIPRTHRPYDTTIDSLSRHRDTLAENEICVQPSPTNIIAPEHRPDLFFSGVIVLVNGYTNPDTDTLQRILHKHGGDLERYETSRVTHIIAEHLSKAKANIYKNRRKPIPVCYPAWIVDSAKSMKLLPHGKYLIDEVRDDGASMPSVASFFCDPASDAKTAENSGAGVSRGRKDTRIKPAVLSLKSSSDSTVQTQMPRRLASERQVQQNDGNVMNVEIVDVHDPSSPVQGGGKEEERVGSFEGQVNNDSRAGPAIGADPSVDLVEGVQMAKELLLDSNEHPTPAAPKTDRQHIDGRVRTVGTDPLFLQSFFAASRLSFIGSYKQRAKQSPTRKIQQTEQQQRFIFHIDMDCFFAAVVLRNYPEFRDKPVAISHNGKQGTSAGLQSTKTKDSTSECATCNYVARSFGIKKGMYLGRAKELCPQLVVLQYDFTGYEEVSEQVVDIVSHYAHNYGGNVEQVSCDEAYLELCLEGENDASTRRHAFDIAEGIRTDIFESTQCTATVGVATNKFLAKLASDRVKPNKSFVVDDYKEILLHFRLRDLHGIGYQLERKLEEEGLVSVQDVWDLGGQAESELVRILGAASGKKIFQFCYGIDTRPVEQGVRKTIGAECNYGVRFNGPYGVEHMIQGLAKEVEKRMVHVGVEGVKVTLKLKQRKPGAPPPPKFLGHGSCYNLSKSCDVPGSKVTCNRDVLANCCIDMFTKMNVKTEDIRGMGIVVSKLQTKEVDSPQKRGGRSILSFFHEVADNRESTLNNRSISCSSPTVQDQEKDLSFGGTESQVSSTNPTAIEQETTARAGYGSNVDSSLYHDFDFEVPSASQIHMSQVQELPSPMRRHILSKIDKGTTGGRGNDIPVDLKVSATEESRFRQVDVRRVMRLAAVKSGEEVLSENLGEQVSLTQLERLPFEMQLQVANNDHRPVGVLSPKSRSSAPRKMTKTTNDIQQRHRNRKVGEKDKQVAHAEQKEDVVLLSSPIESADSFFVENVRPLAIFLDENRASSEQAVAQVVQFLEICMEESRFSDAVVLLRSIKNRQDEWSGAAFDLIFNAVDIKAKELIGDGLDRDWIVSK